MSNDTVFSQPSNVSRNNYILTVTGVVLSLFLFLAILLLAYLPNQPEPANEQIVAERKQKLADNQAKQQSMLKGYSWVNQQEGVVRIPIAQAMHLTVQQIQSKAVNSKWISIITLKK